MLVVVSSPPPFGGGEHGKKLDSEVRRARQLVLELLAVCASGDRPLLVKKIKLLYYFLFFCAYLNKIIL